MKYEIRITTNWNTGDYDSFEIKADDIFDARNKAVEEAISQGYDVEGLNEPVETETTPSGQEEKKIYDLEGIEDYFEATPEVVTDEMREEIETEGLHLVIDIDHDNCTASYYFSKGNHAYTSNEDDYDGVCDFFND